ncbi:MAG: hypothetical protein H6721_09340 [Sandaracinus sp.]|nr:hypothetical protein [Sandaracinus sp.]MCB9614707.1 hypothetical protein [Sandaracinus sp.]MCB9632321.1 hypothetical protein [Sandaracinus sp.]
MSSFVDWSAVVSAAGVDASRCGEAEVDEVLVAALGPLAIDAAITHVLRQDEKWEVVEQVLRRLKPPRAVKACLDAIRSIEAGPYRSSLDEPPEWRDGEPTLSATRLLRFVARPGDIASLVALASHAHPMVRSLVGAAMVDLAYVVCDAHGSVYDDALDALEANEDPHVRELAAKARLAWRALHEEEAPSWRVQMERAGVAPDASVSSGGASVGRSVAGSLLGEALLRGAMTEALHGPCSEAAWSLLQLLKPACVQDWLVEELLARDTLEDDFVAGSLFASVVDETSSSRIRALLNAGTEHALAAAAHALRALLYAGRDVEPLAEEALSALAARPRLTRFADALRDALDEAR